MSVKMHKGAAFQLGVLLAVCASTGAIDSPMLYCSDYHPQTTLDMHQITGIWYGSELLQHHDGENGTSVVDSCVVVHISDTTHELTTAPSPTERGFGGYYENARKHTPPAPVGYRTLRLIWDENGAESEVAIRYNRTRPGLWLASSPSASGPHSVEPAYQIFTGTLQVMKAVDDHLVITFCQTFRTTGELFSILLTRRPNALANDETARIRMMLKRRGLNTASVRKVCRNGADGLFGRMGTFATLTATAMLCVLANLVGLGQ